MKASEFITEAIKQRLDPKCWKGKHKEGTKIKGGVRVNNCVPNESQELNEYIVRSGDDIMSVMSLNLFKDLLGDANLSDYDEEFANSPKWQAVVAEWAPKAEYLQREIAKYQSTGRKLRDVEADVIDATAYDGSDAYENADIAAEYLPKVYNKQASAIVRLLKDGYANPPAGMHEDDSRIVSQNPAPQQTASDDARSWKRDILKSYSTIGRMKTEAIWALENNVYMNKEQILDYIEQKSHDPQLSALEYMHDLGYDTDSIFKNVSRFLTGAGVSPAKIQSIQNKIDKQMGAINERQLAENAPDQKTWMSQVKSKYPVVKFMQAKMPGAPIRAYVDGKVVAEFKFNEKELNEEFDLIESNINYLAERNGVDAETIWEDLESLTDDELYVFAATQPVLEDWQKANKKDKTDGMSQKAVNAYRREHPGSKLKTAVTTKPSKLKKGSKASKRRKSYCSRSRGQMKMHNISCAKTPDKAICKARRRWNCE